MVDNAGCFAFFMDFWSNAVTLAIVPSVCGGLFLEGLCVPHLVQSDWVINKTSV